MKDKITIAKKRVSRYGSVTAAQQVPEELRDVEQVDFFYKDVARIHQNIIALIYKFEKLYGVKPKAAPLTANEWVALSLYLRDAFYDRAPSPDTAPIQVDGVEVVPMGDGCVIDEKHVLKFITEERPTI